MLIILLSLILTGCGPERPEESLSNTRYTYEFRYTLPEAGEVFLVWGVNDWETVPDAERPAGTVADSGAMKTPMNYEAGTFSAKLALAPWTLVNYGFLVTKTSDGTPIEPQWDGKDDYRLTTPEQDRVIETSPSISLSQVQPVTELVEEQINQELRYHVSGAGEVFLVWGIDDWKPVPEQSRPEGTVLHNGLMRTPLTKDGNIFSVNLQVPANSQVDYGFLITKTEAETSIEPPLWEEKDEFKFTADPSNAPIEVNSGLSPYQPEASAPIETSQVFTQEFRYRMPEAGEVLLVWGINGWGTLPEADRPAGTVVQNEVMRTPMNRVDEWFIAQVKVPQGAMVDYGFLITKKLEGEAANPPVWEENENFQFAATDDRVLEIESQLSLREPAQATGLLIVALAVLAGLVVIGFTYLVLRNLPRQKRSARRSRI
jgi:hypothetical protein